VILDPPDSNPFLMGTKEKRRTEETDRRANRFELFIPMVPVLSD